MLRRWLGAWTMPRLPRWARRVRIPVAVLVTAVTAVWVWRAGGHNPPPSPAPVLVPVVVARQRIPAGTLLVPDMLGVWPHRGPAEGTARDPRAVVGMVTLRAIAPGEAVARGILGTPDQVFGAAAAVPDGMRAMTVVVAPSQVFGGHVLPGSRVDVIAVTGVGQPPRAAVLATGVRVLRVGGSRSVASPARPAGSSSGVDITLALPPEVAAPVAVAQVHGQLLLALHPVPARLRGLQETVPASPAAGIMHGSGGRVGPSQEKADWRRRTAGASVLRPSASGAATSVRVTERPRAGASAESAPAIPASASRGGSPPADGAPTVHAGSPSSSPRAEGGDDLSIEIILGERRERFSISPRDRRP